MRNVLPAPLAPWSANDLPLDKRLLTSSISLSRPKTGGCDSHGCATAVIHCRVAFMPSRPLGRIQKRTCQFFLSEFWYGTVEGTLGEMLLDNPKWDCNLEGTRLTLWDAQPTLLDSGILTQILLVRSHQLSVALARTAVNGGTPSPVTTTFEQATSIVKPIKGS